MNYVLEVNAQLKVYRQELNKLLFELKSININSTDEEYKSLSLSGKTTCKGIVDEYLYENAPDYISQIYMSGAIYYYVAMHNLSSIWNETKNKPNIIMFKESKGTDTIIEIFHENIKNLYELESYLDNSIPTVILNTPDSIRYDKFF